VTSTENRSQRASASRKLTVSSHYSVRPDRFAKRDGTRLIYTVADRCEDSCNLVKGRWEGSAWKKQLPASLQAV